MKRFFAICVIFSLAACGGNVKTEVDLVNDFNGRLEVFNRDWNAGKTETLKGQSDTLLQITDELVKTYPESKNLPTLLFKTGEVASKMKDGEKSVAYFSKLVDLYPTNEDAAYALYLIGFQYENVIGNGDKAVEAYRKVRKNYPQSVWASNAKSSILFLMDKDRFFKEIEEGLKASEDSLAQEMK